MKLQLDTSAKTIKIEGTVNLSELFDRIKSILPDWQEYSLESNTAIYNWATPIYIDRYIASPVKPYPWVTYNASAGSTLSANTGTTKYNIEL